MKEHFHARFSRYALPVLCFCFCLVLSFAAMADPVRVVTLGEDLSLDQRIAILKYFGVLGEDIQTIYISNDDEKDRLGDIIPSDKIGSRTCSCVMVRPTSSGGIQVKTANLNYVTSNMIATTLSTSGVVNCEVLAASPFEVSGTGALTGILMAYESASGLGLDDAKKELAVKELYTTERLSDILGKAEATQLVNDMKIRLIENGTQEPVQVSQVVDEVVSVLPEASSLEGEERSLILELASGIAAQEYDYEDMRETLERVDANVSGRTVSDVREDLGWQEQASPAYSAWQEEGEGGYEGYGDYYEYSDPGYGYYVTTALADDSILLATDDSALGESVIFYATTPEAMPGMSYMD